MTFYRPVLFYAIYTTVISCKYRLPGRGSCTNVLLFRRRFIVTTYIHWPAVRRGLSHCSIYIYIYIYIYIHTHTHTRIYIYICVCVCVSLGSYAVCQLPAAVAAPIRAADGRNRPVFAAARVYSLTVPADYVLDLSLA